MDHEIIFHIFFTFYFLIFTVYRSYYTGYVDALGETVPKLEEGLAIRRVRYTLGIPVIGGCLLYVLNPAWMEWSQWPGMPLWMRWLGVLLMGAGAFMYGWTHQHLGKNFTDTVYVRKESRLVTDGPYRYVRHPMYVSAFLAGLGVFFLAANWFIGGLGILLMVIIMSWRTPIEEKKLLQRHGEAYKKYMEQTGRYFPLFR